MRLPTCMLRIVTLAVASCGTLSSQPSVAVRADNLSCDIDAIRGRCLAVSECLEVTFGWQSPTALSVCVVSNLHEQIPGASAFADAYSDSASETVFIEESAWNKSPEVLAHELAHLALPESYAAVSGPLREGLCNLAALACSQSAVELDRIRRQALIGVFNATGGISFEVRWKTPSGETKQAQVRFSPGVGAYLSRTADDVALADPDHQIQRMRAMVATFVLESVARQFGMDVALDDIRKVSSEPRLRYPEMEIARRVGVGSADDLRRAAANEVDLHLLVGIIQDESSWLYPRLDGLGLDLSGNERTQGPAKGIRISLQGSSVVATLADL